jgi:cytochrome bd-type quinol oxidase subunit 2
LGSSFSFSQGTVGEKLRIDLASGLDDWTSAAGAFVLVVPLALACLALFRRKRFERSALEIAVAAALFWGALALALTATLWYSYDTYFAPDWQRTLAPLSAILYAGIGLLLSWLARRMGRASVLAFIALGGLESLAGHAGAI